MSKNLWEPVGTVYRPKKDNNGGGWIWIVLGLIFLALIFH